MKIQSSDLRSKPAGQNATPPLPRPEPVEAKYQTLGRRFLAGLVDGALLTLVTLVLEVALLAFDLRYRYPASQLLVLPVLVLYPIVTTKVWGGTLGKLYFRLVVTRVDPAPGSGGISWLQSVAREVLNLVVTLGNAWFVVLYYVLQSGTSYADYLKSNESNLAYQVFTALVSLTVLVEIATASTSKRRRSIHDFIAGTLVEVVGPYRKGSNFAAILGFVAVAWVQIQVFAFMKG